MFTNPFFNNFSFQMPPDFFKSNLMKKYDDYLDIDKNIISNIREIVNATVQSITLPAIGSEPIIQSMPQFGGTVDVGTESPKPKESLISDKSFSITFRHMDAFINYFTLFEHLIAYKQSTNGTIDDYSRVPDFLVSIYNVHGQIVFTFVLKGVQFLSLDPLEVSKANMSNEFTTFSANFRFDSYSLSFHVPTRKIKH